VSRYFARKTPCNHGHTHASGREAKRCDELHILFRTGQIDGLVVEPTYPLHHNGTVLTMRNGQAARYKPDFTYLERGKVVAEDVKAKNGFVDRDFPLRTALFRACYPEIELRVVK
jgi:hypothetical protein